MTHEYRTSSDYLRMVIANLTIESISSFNDVAPSFVRKGRYSFATSANSIQGFLIALGMSFMNITKCIVPYTERCGNPLLAQAPLDSLPPTNTLCFRPVKNDIIHLKDSPTNNN